ncbi:hypothetical protein IGB42_00803 [Andreprevotia sp. IGB-42]|uniref:PepSY-associated TM helix domain-containing protein n=1 Tax=Andreprevotia sp. IGB-42 TaxID=2497473 RepID=UPI0013585B9C|nr:PepSY-associated TM helix domain-containing protein [Andreprevotia sp. IGB-42]KAF0814748.1 hypothetical protein IGB42_00803 [Andreprevotia sp. IGB-42]
MKSATLKLYRSLHTWTGILCGLTLFVAFYAGAITVFHEDLHQWQNPGWRTQGQETPADAQKLLTTALAAHPELKGNIAIMPAGSHSSPNNEAYWYDPKIDDWAHKSLADFDPQTRPQHGSELADFVDSVHRTLGIPVAGQYVMGIVSIIYALALVSGVLIHLRQLVDDLFAVRPGKNKKRFWQDAHNLIGVISLPFHIIFAITGALFSLFVILMAAFNFGVFDGQLEKRFIEAVGTVPPNSPQASGKPAAMLSVAQLTARARALAPDFEPSWLGFSNYGDSNAYVEILGNTPQTVSRFTAMTLKATNGSVVKIQTRGERDVNHAVMSSLYGLHFGNYAGDLVRWAYFLLGLSGAVLFYSGNLLWIESRRKHRQQQQARAPYRMAQGTLGWCLGTCLGISLAFSTALLAPMAGLDAARWEKIAGFGGFFVAILWSFARPPARGAVELLMVTAMATLAIPLVNGLVTGDHLLLTPWHGQWAIFGVDLTATLMGAGFVYLAALSRRRSRNGQPNSVWALDGPPDITATTPDAQADAAPIAAR